MNVDTGTLKKKKSKKNAEKELIQLCTRVRVHSRGGKRFKNTPLKIQECQKTKKGYGEKCGSRF